MRANPKTQLALQPMESTRPASVSNLIIGQPLQLVDAGREQEIAVLRGGQWGTHSIEQTLKGATWTFYPNGKFIFIPQREENSSLVPFIAGTYVRVGDRLELQGEYLHSGSGFSIDGQLQAEGEVLVLEMLYTHSTRQSQQIAEIRQTLTPVSAVETWLPQLDNGIPAGLTPSETLESALLLPEADITTVVEGVPVPSTFEILVSGTTGTQPFSELPGKLIISESNSENSHPFDVLIATTTAETVNGWLVWQSQQDGQAASGEMQITDGRVQMEITPDTNLPALQWWFSLAGEDGSEIGAFAETAVLTFSVEGEHISGEIWASGRYSSSTEFNQPTTYTATFTGQKQKSNVEEALRALFNTSSFNGQWNTEETSFGRIELRQQSQNVSGSYTGYGGGTITGTIEGNWLNFTWQDRQRGQGWGVFRSLAGGGTLAGFWGQDLSRIDKKTLLATWQLPSEITSQTLSADDIGELRYLGRDLAEKGRCEQATEVLTVVLSAYRQQREEGISTLQAETDLIRELMPLNSLVRCSFQVGDYDKLLNHLDYALDIQYLLSPAESSSRAFRRLTQALTDELTKTAETYKTLQTKFIRYRDEESSFVGVGVQLDQDPQTGAVIVASVVENSPADAAGVLAGDVVIAVGGQNIQGLDLVQVVEQLQGDEGTRTILKVKRGGEQLDMVLIRSRIEPRSPYRSINDTKEAFTSYIDHLDDLQEKILADLNEIDMLAKRIARGEIAAVEALNSLTEYIAKRREDISHQVNEIISEGRVIFQEQKELLQKLDTLLKETTWESCSAVPRDVDFLKIASLEEEFVESIRNNRELTPLEKNLFYDGLLGVPPLIRSYAVQIDCKRNLLIQEADPERFNQRLQQTQRMSSRLAEDLERWRTRLVIDSDRIGVLEQGQPFFKKLTEFLVNLGYEKEALIASEQSRARAFVDLLNAKTSQLPIVTPNTDSPTLEQLQAIARDQNATLVEYAIISDKTLYIWVVKPAGEITFEKVDLSTLSNSLADLVETSRMAIGVTRGLQIVSVRPRPGTEQQQTQQLKQLYQLLIQPIADQLPTDPNAPVIFVPQGELFSVPFAALKDTSGNDLIDKHTILTSPSIQILDKTRQLITQVQQANLHDVLVVGNPIMPYVSLPGESPQQLIPLIGAKQEAEAIAPLLQTQPLIGSQAKKATVVQRMQQARMIHLATHGLLDDQQGLDSAIALAPDGTGEINDGLLTAVEIAQMKLNAELVVLSACNTGQGRITGDGVIGLSRALITAGVPSVLVSLWSVPDAPTAELMSEFYHQLQQTGNKAQALRQAMLITKAKHPNPRDWAAFTLLGEAQ